LIVCAPRLIDSRSNLAPTNDLVDGHAGVMKASMTVPAWMKHFLSILHVENIKIIKRVIVSVVGLTVLLIGVALLILPGPAFVVIPVGLAILATEYAWARRWLSKARQIATDVISQSERTES
jgi:uncharacterized protein (TIGR02611 family)